MKKHILLLAACAAALGCAARTAPNRVIVNSSDGSSRSVMTERVDNISFATVEGEVKAGVEVEKFDTDKELVFIELSATPECTGWKYTIIPSVSLKNYDTDAKLAKHIDDNCEYILRTDFTKGAIEAKGLIAGGEYALCTVGIDRYNTLCEVSVTTFILKHQVSGAPVVDVTVSNITDTSFEATLTPNDDCTRFCFALYPAGELESMYEFYGSQMGASSVEDFLANYLCYTSYDTSYSELFSGLERGRSYDICVVPFDRDGAMCPLQKTTVTTGGAVEGSAVVKVELDEYAMMLVPNPDNMLETINLPHQAFMFTPNEATVKWRAEAYTKEEFEAIGLEAAKAQVKTDPEIGVPDDMWFRYGKRTQRWQFDPGTSGYVLVAGKNAKGEWGEVSMLEFTTPDQLPPAQSPVLVKKNDKRRSSR